MVDAEIKSVKDLNSQLICKELNSSNGLLIQQDIGDRTLSIEFHSLYGRKLVYEIIKLEP